MLDMHVQANRYSAARAARNTGDPICTRRTRKTYPQHCSRTVSDRTGKPHIYLLTKASGWFAGMPRVSATHDPQGFLLLQQAWEFVYAVERRVGR